MAQTVLLLDKDPLFLDETRQRLIGAGFRVLCARSVTEAERILEKTRPDVVISEVMLARPDGGFILAWKVKKRYPEVPVILVSAVTWQTGLYFNLSTPEDRAWIRADHFIDKPVRWEELESVIRHSLVPAPASAPVTASAPA